MHYGGGRCSTRSTTALPLGGQDRHGRPPERSLHSEQVGEQMGNGAESFSGILFCFIPFMRIMSAIKLFCRDYTKLFTTLHGKTIRHFNSHLFPFLATHCFKIFPKRNFKHTTILY